MCDSETGREVAWRYRFALSSLSRVGGGGMMFRMIVPYPKEAGADDNVPDGVDA
ncbi:MAG: hypothetical protein ABSA58_18935 [Acetobacteraceae bacterium]